MEVSDESPKVRLSSKSQTDETCATYTFMTEDHTLGNALRYMVMKNPQVEFCGYSLPHPSKDEMNIRVQTRAKGNATQELKRGLEDLKDLCEHVLGTFSEQVETIQPSTQVRSEGIVEGSVSDDAME